MKKTILKRALALGCLTLALFCVVKKEEDNKKPIIMKQMVVAEEVLANSIDDETIVLGEVADKVGDLDEYIDESDKLIDETIKMNETQNENIEEGLSEKTLTTDGGIVERSEVVEYQADEELSVLVVGSAVSSVTPDSAVIFARIETLENDCATSKDATLEIFNGVVTALTEKGLQKDNIKLECFNCSPCYEFSLTKAISGYCATACISVELHAIDTLQEYIDLLTENGVCCIDNISYKVADMEGEYNTALSQALDNARIKAEKLTGQTGLTLVKVKEEMVHSPMLLKSTLNEVKLADYVGKVDIEARVIAIFEK